MGMNTLFDEIARTLASPVSRRQACARILRGVAGAALASVFGVGSARAANPNCKPNELVCGSICCNQNQICCGSGATAFCCKQNQTCGATTCQSNISPSVHGGGDGR